MSEIVIHTGGTDITPGEADFDSRVITKLDDHFIDLIKQERLQAADYLLARGGKIFARKTMGKLRYDDPDTEYMPGTIRWIASLGKVFTSVGIMQLVEQGWLYLEQPVADIIKEFDTPLHRGVTIFNLLTHTGGIKADSGFYLEPYPYWKKIENMEELILAFLEGPVQFEPGTVWSYSSLGFCILGEIIRRVSGLYFEDYITKHILLPLGMTDSHYKLPEEKAGRFCLIDEEENERFSNKPANSPFSPSGGLLSSVDDLFKLGQMFLNKGTFGNARILGRKTVEAMSRNRMKKNTPSFYWGRDAKDWKYGLGLNIPQGEILSPGCISHEGAGRCGLYLDPSEDFLMMYMVPSPPGWDPETIVNPRYIVWSGLN